MLVDRVKIKVVSGDGGDGLLSFDNRGKAYGGDGGKGGDVILIGDTNTYDLSRLDDGGTYHADSGGKGETYRKHGKDADPLIIKLPLVTIITDEEGNEIATISEHDQEFRLLEGGKGGVGNYTLRGEGWEGKMSRRRPEKGNSMKIRLELNLKSDVILLGLPNAGKSSLINALTRSKSKVASYEFTTLEPQLGVMDGYIRLMDLPGLIEGTYQGKGVGTEFLKHVKYSKLLVHCISIENIDMVKSYNSMRKEFANISKDLESLPELIVLTKADIIGIDNARELQDAFEKEVGKETLLLSSYLEESMDILKRKIKSMLDYQKN
jgi:GTP-binding protein